jgi:plasmid stabilization system protein ParE
MGRTVPEFPGTGVREMIEGRYRIVCRIRAKGIQVLTGFDGHRQFPTNDVGE